MKRTIAQRILIVSGILALLGGGSCFFAFFPPVSGDGALGWAIIGGFSGIAALVLAAILYVIGSYVDQGEDIYRHGLRLKEKAQRLPDNDESTGQSQGKAL